MQCYKCDTVLKDADALKCISCKTDYHYYCASLTEDEFKRILPMNKAKWKCPTCKKPANRTPVKDMETLCAYMDTKFGEQRSALQSDIHTEINSVQASITNLESKIESQISDLNAAVQNCVTRVVTLETDFSQITKSFEELQSVNEELKNDLLSTKTKFSKLEQQARACNIEIQNVPESKNENLENIVLSLGTLIGVKLDLSHIRAVHRIAHNKAGTGRPKAIVAQLTTRRLRDDVLAAARVRRDLQSDCLPELKGKPAQPIYVNQHLTLENKILFSKARVLKKNGYSWVWVKDGNIMARKEDDTPILHIRSESDITKLMDKS